MWSWTSTACVQLWIRSFIRLQTIMGRSGLIIQNHYLCQSLIIFIHYRFFSTVVGMVLSQSPRGSTLGADSLHKTCHRSSFAHCILSLHQQLQAIGSIQAPGLSNMAVVHATQPCPALSLTKDWQLYISITQYIGIGQKIFFFCGPYCPPIQRGFTGWPSFV